MLRRSAIRGPVREVVAVHPYRSEPPRAVRRELIEGARRRIRCAGCTSYFLWTEVPRLRGTLAARSTGTSPTSSTSGRTPRPPRADQRPPR
ncbi:hypothetical protein GCM10010123_05200 [Pilimelia anulata]|uniref:Uncharacterized protein n=1 Tax=Pilimelia anulata TaxID=53371 RepID=A0A8J3B338_9ACTN|nr:hypothetical protein [Pilimelia anulata]GGJ78088.1 hypothetical protein GCM10010123_05200 [Pilimelia anulata]